MNDCPNLYCFCDLKPFFFLLLKSFEDARFAMALVKPVMLVIDESCYSWYFKFRQFDIQSLKWRVLLDSPSSDFAKTWNGRNICVYSFTLRQNDISMCRY